MKPSISTATFPCNKTWLNDTLPTQAHEKSVFGTYLTPKRSSRADPDHITVIYVVGLRSDYFH